ncbi:histidine decarboxylase [Kitasatospora sp. NPDC092286]|uniref:histidine decarboxylase n=1 Tax=Kitasatospora sp. NPDC092286 TaxID=3364087 RepID=UPI0037F205A6
MTNVRTRSKLAPFPFGPDGQTWEKALSDQGVHNGKADLVSAPFEDPRDVYKTGDPGLKYQDFELQISGFTDKQRNEALAALEKYLAEKHKHMLGYQFTQDMNGYQQDLGRFLANHTNNIGDPFVIKGGYQVNTRIAERAVLDYYAALWRATWPHDPDNLDSYWGYMLSMGSTEGNMYGVWNGRDYLSGKALFSEHDPKSSTAPLRWVQAAVPRGKPDTYYQPVVFYSEDAHYSFAKAVRILDVDTFSTLGERLYQGKCPLKGSQGKWPTEVPSRNGESGTSADGPGEIDVDALATLVEFFAAEGHPILVSLNYGSTFKGAHDDVRAVCDRLLPIFEKYDLIERDVLYMNDAKGNAKPEKRRGFWIHVDGALGAGYAPFQRMAFKDKDLGWTPDVDLPEFDFGLKAKSAKHGEIDMVCSMSLSGHKWPGAPWPCGIYMTKVKYQMKPPSQTQYIGSPDTTFAGSRNGFSPLVLWDHLARHSYKDQVKRIKEAQELTDYLEQQLKTLEKEGGLVLWTARTKGTLAVRFRRPSDETVAKWSLSTLTVKYPDQKSGGQIDRPYAHAFALPGASEKQIDELVADLRKDPVLTKPPALKPTTPRPIAQLAEGAVPIGLVHITGRGMQ